MNTIRSYSLYVVPHIPIRQSLAGHYFSLFPLLPGSWKIFTSSSVCRVGFNASKASCSEVQLRHTSHNLSDILIRDYDVKTYFTVCGKILHFAGSGHCRILKLWGGNLLSSLWNSSKDRQRFVDAVVLISTPDWSVKLSNFENLLETPLEFGLRMLGFAKLYPEILRISYNCV